MTIYYADCDKTINKSVYKAVEACIGMTVPKSTYGNYVVMSGPSCCGAAEHSNMTLMDFRYTLDFFSTYFDDTIHDIPSQNSVRALKICSPLEHELYGRKTFASVWVDRDFNGTLLEGAEHILYLRHSWHPAPTHFFFLTQPQTTSNHFN
jgi:hypothetical protein